MPTSQAHSGPRKGPAGGTSRKRPEPKKTPGRRMSREELSRYEREVRANRMILIGMGAVLVLVVAILGFGWWREYVGRASEPVATVAGRSISTESFARRLDFQRKTAEQEIQYMQAQLQASSGNESLAGLIRQQIQQLQFSLLLLPDQTLDQMITEELLRREATRRGLSVSPSEVEEEIKKTFGDQPTPAPTAPPTAAPGVAGQATPQPAPTSTPGPSPTPMPTADVQSRLNLFLTTYGITRAEYTSMVEAQLLYRKLQEAMGAEVPTSADQVHARHILMETEEKAKELAEKLKNGASFEDLARAESEDSASKEKGGDLGWFPRGVMVPQFEEVAFQLEPRQVSDPVESPFGWHIIEVLEKEQNRPLDEEDLDSLKSGAISKWLEAARTSPDVKRELTDERRKWVFERIDWSPPF